MTRIGLIAGLLVAVAAAQANLASPGFQYIGCVEADPDSFPVGTNLGNNFTIGQCQIACGNRSGSYAAAASSGCRCSASVSQAAVDFDITDESRCSRPCDSSDPDAGQCGGSESANGKQLFNLFQSFPQKNTPTPESTSVPVLSEMKDMLETVTTIVSETVTMCTSDKTGLVVGNGTAVTLMALPTSLTAQDSPVPVTQAPIPYFENSTAFPTVCLCKSVKPNKTKDQTGPRCTDSSVQSWAVPPLAPDGTIGPIVISEASAQSLSLLISAVSFGAFALTIGMV